MTSNQCPYCKRPTRADGSTVHEGGCAGLEKVELNRLQYDALVARGSVHETRCSECGGSGRVNVIRIGNEVNVPCPACSGQKTKGEPA